MPIHSFRILVVDNHIDMLAAYDYALRDIGHVVFTADSVAKAREVFDRELNLDLIISDLDLCDGDGCTLARTLLSRRGMRAIAVTSYAEDYDRQRTRAAGFAMHLTKPLDLDRLTAAVAEVMVGYRKRTGLDVPDPAAT